MADGVQWIKMKVGMFDGESFKRIKKAKIGGVEFRDKLTAVWFELMDFAAKCNHDGALINSHEIPYKSLGDIATMIDRDESEVDLCMRFFVQEGMIEIIDDIYMLSAWQVYQNADALAKIRENNRNRVAAFRQRKRMESVELPALPEPEIETEEPKPTSTEKKKKTRTQKPFIPPTIKEVEDYCKQRGNHVDAKRFFDYYEISGWFDKNGDPVRNWKQKMIANWEEKAEPKQPAQENNQPKRPKYEKY